MIQSSIESQERIEKMTPIGFLILNIMPYASIIEQTYAEHLMPPEPGIYKFGELKPAIYNNKNYYTQQKQGDRVVRVPVTDFNLIEDTVVDDMDRIVVPAYMMRNKRKYLFNEPAIPARGAEIIRLLIENYFARISPWARAGNYTQKMCAFFKPDQSDIVEELFLERLCESLLCQIQDFVGQDIWNIYFVKFMSLDICVEKSIDYRIYDWTMKKQQQLEDGL